MANYFTSTLVCFLYVKLLFILLSTAVDESELPTAWTVSTQNVTAHFCPFPCTMGNETVCVPPPCPPPACIDPAKYKPTDCCEYCPHGPNCRGPDGRPIQWYHWKIVDGKNCTCKDMAYNATCV